MKGLFSVSALCAAGAAFALGTASGRKMPQLASGGDALSVAFGGAKEAISDAMFREADSYFHGGVDMDCSCDHRHGYEHDHDDHDHEVHEHDVHEHEGQDHDAHEHHDSDHESERHGLDPWAWINEHVRAPEVERHLEGEKAVELMPWFWASIKANPGNVEAWTTAVYIADRTVKNAKLASQILADAKKANPRSMEIAFAEGRFLYQGGKGDPAAALVAFANARQFGLESCRGDVSRLSVHDKDVFMNILDYLSIMAAKRKDAGKLTDFLAEAMKINPDNIVSKNIANRISALESHGDIR